MYRFNVNIGGLKEIKGIRENDVAYYISGIKSTGGGWQYMHVPLSVPMTSQSSY
jgi:hypothetical protein